MFRIHYCSHCSVSASVSVIHYHHHGLQRDFCHWSYVLHNCKFNMLPAAVIVGAAGSMIEQKFREQKVITHPTGYRAI